MAIVAVLVALGSAILSFVVAWQIKHVPPAAGPVIWYYLKALPLLFAANAFLGLGFVRAHQVLKNLPLLAAAQSFAYYLFLLICSIVIIGDRVPVARALAGFALLAAGVFVLKG
ncbi:MAG TPA: hypothetical protein GXX19_09505 [Syntrophomonadaceae bacterium]|nr:hypothetical protein [Syntrophomonadaceae bacterium]